MQRPLGLTQYPSMGQDSRASAESKYHWSRLCSRVGVWSWDNWRTHWKHRNLLRFGAWTQASLNPSRASVGQPCYSPGSSSKQSRIHLHFDQQLLENWQYLTSILLSCCFKGLPLFCTFLFAPFLTHPNLSKAQLVHISIKAERGIVFIKFMPPYSICQDAHDYIGPIWMI